MHSDDGNPAHSLRIEAKFVGLPLRWKHVVRVPHRWRNCGIPAEMEDAFYSSADTVVPPAPKKECINIF